MVVQLVQHYSKNAFASLCMTVSGNICIRWHAVVAMKSDELANRTLTNFFNAYSSKITSQYNVC